MIISFVYQLITTCNLLVLQVIHSAYYLYSFFGVLPASVARTTVLLELPLPGSEEGIVHNSWPRLVHSLLYPSSDELTMPYSLETDNDAICKTISPGVEERKPYIRVMGTGVRGPEEIGQHHCNPMTTTFIQTTLKVSCSPWLRFRLYFYFSSSFFLLYPTHQ